MTLRARAAAAALLCLPAAVPAQTLPLDIRLAHGTEAEARTRDQVLRLVRAYDVGAWLFTRSVVIDEGEIPHSHPVLTLHTRHLNEDLHLLSTLIHEQFHWFLDEHREATDSAVAAFRARWPDVPVGGGTGARDAHSTYVHLIVCDLEYQAMTRLVGAERADGIMASWTHYTWIYERVRTEAFVRETTRRFGLIAP